MFQIRILKDWVFLNISAQQRFEILLQRRSPFPPKKSSRAVGDPGTLGESVTGLQELNSGVLELWVRTPSEYFKRGRKNDKNMSFQESLKLLILTVQVGAKPLAPLAALGRVGGGGRHC